MKKFGLYLLNHRANAAFIALLCVSLSFFHLPVAWIASVIIALITLRKGYKEGLFVLLWAALPAVALAVTGRFEILINSILLGCFLSWLLALVLKRYHDWQPVLELASILGIVVVLIVHVSISDVANWWASHVIAYFAQLSNTLGLEYDVTIMQPAIKGMSPIMTGLWADFVLLNAVSFLFLARWWQAFLFNPGGLSKECHSLRMNKIDAIVFVVTFLLLLITRTAFIVDVFPVLIMPFFLAGLSLLHAVLTGRTGRWPVLIGVYALMGLFLPYIASVLALMGCLDSWGDFRVRLAPRNSRQ